MALAVSQAQPETQVGRRRRRGIFFRFQLQLNPAFNPPCNLNLSGPVKLELRLKTPGRVLSPGPGTSDLGSVWTRLLIESYNLGESGLPTHWLGEGVVSRPRPLGSVGGHVRVAAA